jgi:hypothetical protein
MSHLSEEQLDQIIAEERAREQAPLNKWQTIAARAREEGLIQGPQARSWVSRQAWIQAAAAILLLVGGIAIGRTTIAIPSSPQSAADSQQVTGGGRREVGGESTSGATTGNGIDSFASVDDASATLERAIVDYQRASAFLAKSTLPTTVDSSGIYRTRLAALDKVNNAMESALETAPHDPVINQYYLATMGARVATQQMAARPVGLALRGF